MKHLAIFNDKESIEKILRGEKKMEGRFSREKRAPYGVIKKGDEIYLKEAGKPIKGKVKVDNVLFYDNLTPEMIGKIKKEYEKELCFPEDFWKKYQKAKCISLIFLRDPYRFISSIRIKKRDRRGWAIIKN